MFYFEITTHLANGERTYNFREALCTDDIGAFVAAQLKQPEAKRVSVHRISQRTYLRYRHQKGRSDRVTLAA